jgi:peptide deformylase
MAKKSEIVQLGADILRQQAKPVDDFDSTEFLQLLDQMHVSMLEANGVGIAAPQLGESWQIVIIASRPTKRYPLAPEMSPLVMVNPRYEIMDNTLHKDWEGCLSVPGIRALVPRYRSLQIEYQDQHGRFHEITLQDFPARVFQHEFDHLQGMVYLDRVENSRDIISEFEFFKRIAD